MKIKKLLQVLVVFVFVFSCTKDTFEEPKVDTDPRIASDQFDNSHLGVYKGLFSTNDGLTRGTVVVTLSPSNEGIAQITLSSGEMIELKSSRVKLTADNTVSNLRFSSEGLSAIDAILEFSVEGDGINPVISNVNFDNMESDILIAKNLSRAPLSPITGTYLRTSGGGSFPTTGRTWNVMSIGMGNGQTYASQIAFGGAIYNTGPTGSQSNCQPPVGTTTTCTISGTGNVSGFAVSWTGTHQYRTGNNANENACSSVSGTWSAPAYGGSVGTFVSDSDCTGPAVANDLCAGAIAVSAGTYTGSSLNATNTSAPTGCANGLTTGRGVWYSYTSPVNANVTVDTEGTTFPPDTSPDTLLGVFSGTCGALTCIESDDDDGSGLLSTITFAATANVTYYIYLVGFNNTNDFGAYQLNVSEIIPPDNDTCQTATTIACGGSASGSTANASPLAAGFCGTSLTGSPGVWYVYSPVAAQTVTVNTVGSGFNTKLGVFTGTCAGLVCVNGNDDFTGLGTASQVTFNACPGQTFYFFVTGTGAAVSGNYNINVSCTPITAPTYTSTTNRTCNGTVIDNGGANGNYSNDRLDVYYVDAGAGNKARLTFNNNANGFSLENGFDFMRVYDGQNSLCTPLITVGTQNVDGTGTTVTATANGFTGTTGVNSLRGRTVTSTGRYMTVVFQSDVSVTSNGFNGTVTCVSAREAMGIPQTDMTNRVESVSGFGPFVVPSKELSANERRELEAKQRELSEMKKKG